MEIKLKGKTALVTGASRGIGKAIALHLARAGADVAVNYHHSREKAEGVCIEIDKMGSRSMTVGADVSQPDEVQRMLSQVCSAFDGKIDILVNNAGIYNVFKNVVDMSPEEWNRTIETNVTGSFLVSRLVGRIMMDNRAGGRIIGITSGAGHAGRPGQGHYCASKAGLMLLCKTMAIELASHDITVNTISVGFVNVGQFDSPEKKNILEDIIPRILLRRAGTPDDIAHIAVFLASEQAAWITGADFRVDGGESAGRVPAEE